MFGFLTDCDIIGEGLALWAFGRNTKGGKDYVDTLCGGFFFFRRDYDNPCEVWNSENRF